MPFLVRTEKRSNGNQCMMKYAVRQSAQTDSPVIPNPLHRAKKASCQALPGSMTVEAAMVMPLFLYAIINLLSLILMFQEYSVQEAKLHQTGRQMSLLAYGQEEGKQDIELVTVSPVRALIPIAAFPSAVIVNGCVMHKWTGYDLFGPEASSEETGEALVYVTRSGTAYHKSRNCVYLNPSIRMMTRRQAEEAVNAEQQRYTPCILCGGGSGIVYVTETGTRYHSTAGCSGIKRTIDSIPLSEALASGRHACAKCGG